MEWRRTSAGAFLVVVGGVLAVPPTRALLGGPESVGAFVLAVLGVAVSTLLAVGGAWLMRSDVVPRYALRVAGWMLAGLTLTLVVLGVAMRVDSVSTPPLFAATLLAITAFAHVVIGVTDIRRIRAEDLAAARQKTAVFTRVLRHNLRTEAQLLAGAAERVDGGGDEVQRRAASLAALSDAATEIEAALDRGEGGTTTADVAALAGAAAEAVRDEHPEATIEGPATTECPATCGEQFEVAVRELLVNAVEHGEGTVTVEVDCDDEARVTVRDEGPGVPATERDVVTGSNAETALDHSDGLGLWMAKWVAESFGGGIRFEEDGSAVTVWVAS